MARRSSIRRDPVREAGEGQGLQDDATGAGQLHEEQAFTAEQRRLDARHHLDVVVDRIFHRHDAAGVDAQDFTGSEAHFRQCA